MEPTSKLQLCSQNTISVVYCLHKESMKQRMLECRSYGSIEQERQQIAYVWNELYASKRRILIFIGMGSIGKTFKPLEHMLAERILGDTLLPFIYVVDNDETRKVLTLDSGEGFWGRISEKSSNKKLRAALKSGKMSSSNRTIRYEDKTLCHIIPFNFYMKYKNLSVVSSGMFLDEFIPEQINYQNKDIDAKVQSIMQTLEREDHLDCIMCANPKTLDNPIIESLGLSDIQEGYIGYTKNAAIAWISASQLPCIAAMNRNSLAGIMAEGTGVKHRTEGTISLSTNHGTAKGEVIYNIFARGFKLGVYRATKRGCYVLGKPGDKHIYSRNKTDITKNSIVNENAFEAITNTYASGNLLFASLYYEELFKKMFAIKGE